MPIKNKNIQINDEFLFLIICCKVNLSSDDMNFIYAYLVEQKSNIDTIIELAKKHGVLPLIYKTLKNLDSDTFTLKSNLLTNIKSVYTQIAQTNILMSAELINIIKLLQKNDIGALSFKGPTLSKNAYGDITLRQFGDLDILIRKKDRSRMLSLLLEEEYIPEINLKQETQEVFFDCVNVIGFEKASNGTRIEIHWELLSKNYAINWEEKNLWNKQDTTSINNIPIPTLHFEQLILYLCVHGSKHLYERLEWICDIDRSVRENPDINWEYLLSESEKLGIRRMIFLGLSLSQEFFQLELPPMITQKIAKDKVLPKLISEIININFSTSVQQRKNYSSFGLLWDIRENFFDQLRFTRFALFAPKFDDFKFIQLPKYLTFLYPIVRPIRLMTKYFNRSYGN